jgi:uncharacterized protein with HEPN domain
MKEKNKYFLEDMLTSIRNIENKTRNLDYKHFKEDEEIRCLVSQELDSLSGALGICPDGIFRDIDPFLLWDIIHKRVPQLKDELLKSLIQS